MSAREINGIFAIGLKVIPKIKQVLQAILQKLASFLFLCRCQFEQ
jgi:hypothetical protein